MNFDFRSLAPRERYKILTATIVPRPIALVTSLSTGGVLNAAPFSFFNCVGSDPPLIVLGIGNREGDVPKDTAANIMAREEFVVNLVNEELAPQMSLCAVDFPAEMSEVEVLGLETAPSEQVGVPRLSASPVAFECRLERCLQIGHNRVIIGQVVAAHIEDALVHLERLHIDTAALHLVGRMGGAGGYARTRDTFEIERQNYAEWKANQP